MYLSKFSLFSIFFKKNRIIVSKKIFELNNRIERVGVKYDEVVCKSWYDEVLSLWIELGMISMNFSLFIDFVYLNFSWPTTTLYWDNNVTLILL